MVFHVINNGDYEVGISGWSLEITVNGPVDELTEKSEFIDRMKVFLKDEFGQGDGVTHVMTQDEIDDNVMIEEQLNEGE